MRLRLYMSPLLVLLLTFLQMHPADPCNPGRGYGRRRTQGRSVPLVLKQHVPNVVETSLAASGPPEGRVERGTERFRRLVVSDNADVVFKNDEHNGHDLIMSVRCRDAVNALSLLVSTQWPGLRLRVTEAWHPSSTPHPGAWHTHNDGDSHSLHDEGRAVDVTTSDRDRRKLGLLARLAVDAGFDWVYFASRSHVHCSVKPDSSIVALSGGCFPGTSRVRTQDGQLLPLSQLVLGDRVLAFDPGTASLFYDDVIAFLHRSQTGNGNTTFVQITVSGGATITLTYDHLIYTSNSSDIPQRFAGNVVRGDYVFYAHGDTVVMREVVGVEVVHSDAGYYAPLTMSGNIVVDDVICSCYAVTSHRLAHLAMAPLRVARYLGIERTVTSLLGVQFGDGIHPYAALLRTVGNYFLPEMFGTS